MKHRLLIATAATALMAVPTLAHAQDSGVYIKGQLGYGVFTDTEVGQSRVGTNTIVGDVGASGDLALGLGLGYDFGENWRIELNGSRLFNDLGAIGGQPNTDAKLGVNAVMANAIYDFSDFGRWEPYVGAGVGIAQGNVSLFATDVVNPAGPALIANPACQSVFATPSNSRSCDINDKDTNFAWNIIAGLGYDITDKLSWDTNYTYMDIGDYTAAGTFTTSGTASAVTGVESVLEDVSSHTIMTGFRYRFGASTPAPVVVPPTPVVETFTCWDGLTEVTDRALCPPRPVTCWDGSEAATLDLCPVEPVMVTCPDGVTMVSDLAACPVVVQPTCGQQFRQDVIYYEFDRAQSAETRNAINRVLDVGQFCQISSIRVVGHTDTSGARSYNQRLSERRAADATAELVRQGVSATAITSEGKGEMEPAVQTGDGVRNQQNRRTEVLITLSELGGTFTN